MCLQGLDLVAHRGLRDTQFLGGAGEAEVSGGGLEGAKRSQRGKLSAPDIHKILS